MSLSLYMMIMCPLSTWDNEYMQMEHAIHVYMETVIIITLYDHLDSLWVVTLEHVSIVHIAHANDTFLLVNSYPKQSITLSKC